MAIELNHTIVWASDPDRSAQFLASILGRPAPVRFSHFRVVAMDNGVQLDFARREGEIHPQHYAFLIEDEDFDPVFARIEGQGLPYWADPGRTKPGEINRRDGGRGVYFPDPDGHLLEVLTRPYGSRQ